MGLFKNYEWFPTSFKKKSNILDIFMKTLTFLVPVCFLKTGFQDASLCRRATILQEEPLAHATNYFSFLNQIHFLRYVFTCVLLPS